MKYQIIRIRFFSFRKRPRDQLVYCLKSNLSKKGGMKQALRSFKMRPYPYLQKECRNGEERRKSRVTDVIIFKYIDRRQINDPYYIGPERRTVMDRRGLIWDRRKPKASCYGNSVPFFYLLQDKYRPSVYSRCTVCNSVVKFKTGHA